MKRTYVLTTVKLTPRRAARVVLEDSRSPSTDG